MATPIPGLLRHFNYIVLSGPMVSKANMAVGFTREIKLVKIGITLY